MEIVWLVSLPRKHAALGRGINIKVLRGIRKYTKNGLETEELVGKLRCAAKI